VAYNVFKRPMFKRGGSTTGTGIMSHVEPRVKAAFGFPNFGVSQQPSQQQIDAFRQAEADRINRIRNQSSGILGPRFTDPNYQSPFQNFFSTNTGFGFMNLGIPDGGSGITANIAPKTPVGAQGKTGVEIGLEGTDGITEYEYNTEEKKQQKQESDRLENLIKKEKQLTEKSEPSYEKSLEETVEDERDMLRKLLKNENYSKGELALIIAGAMKKPGNISDKLDEARRLAIPVARERRKEDKALTLAAYKFAKEKEKYQERYGKETDYIRNLRTQAKSLYGTPGYEGKTEKQIFDSLLASKTESSEGRYYYLKSAGKEIDNRTEDILETRKELAKLKPGTPKYEKKKAELDEMISIFNTKYASLPEFDMIYRGRRKALGLKEGGRVMKAVGGDVDEEDDEEIVTSQVSFGEDNKQDATVVEKPVEKLSYAQLRDRLPAEITNDVVQLLSNSEEALQDFAYIRTQEDVNTFNVKYGVNLVIPPQQG